MRTFIIPVHAIGFGPQGLIAAFHMIESTTVSPREDGAMFFTWLWPFLSQVQTGPGADANSYSNATRNSGYHDLGVIVSTSAGNLVDLVQGAAAAGSVRGMDQPVAPPLRPLLQRQDPSMTSLARFKASQLRGIETRNGSASVTIASTAAPTLACTQYFYYSDDSSNSFLCQCNDGTWKHAKSSTSYTEYLS